ncbi:hypothetical protein HY218_02260 [Candidatus Saccharibacteria bacterium]|nr:hypothetical protein [Candidatus Saccharibacteria bacterium]
MFKIKRKAQPRASRPGSGNTQTPVFSYYHNRPPDLTKPTNLTRLFKRNRSKTVLPLQLRRLPSYVAWLIIVGSLLYALTLSTEPKIVVGQPTIETSLLRNSAIYQKAIHDILNHSIFNHSKLTINTQSVAHQITSTFPEIQNATITIPLIGHRPVIGLDPAQPSVVITGPGGSFILAADGQALVKAADAPKQLRSRLPDVQDDSRLTIEQGRGALPKDTVVFMTTIIIQLSLQRVALEKLRLPAVVNEFDATPTGQPYYIKFDVSGDARLQAGTFLATRQWLDSQHLAPKEYIDVRVDERAYYK